MGPQTRILCDRLHDAIQLLDRVQEHHWSKWFSTALTRIQNGDLSGVHQILASYGGMGSFNDLVIHSANGHHVTDTEYSFVNERLEKLRSELYDLAKMVRKNAVVE